MNTLEIFDKNGKELTIEEVLAQALIIDLPQITRVEAIDVNGRAYVNWFDKTKDIATISLQDEGRTLKVFVRPQKLED